MSNNFQAPDISRLPLTLTSYDFLKASALLLMIVDHVGYYFYPDQDWFRVVGRFSAPIWLFLIGYARSRDLSLRMWVGIGVLTLSSYVAGMPVLPLTILATMVLCRVMIDPLMDMLRARPKMLYPLTALLFVGTFLTFGFVEYGSVAMLMVMTGYMVRNAESLPFNKSELTQFVGVSGLLYGAMQVVMFPTFDTASRLFVVLGLTGLMVFLMRFRPYEYPALTAKTPGLIAGVIRLAGRRTLEFYVLHLLIFKALSHFLGTHKHQLFTFHIW